MNHHSAHDPRLLIAWLKNGSPVRVGEYWKMALAYSRGVWPVLIGLVQIKMMTVQRQSQSSNL